MKKAIIVLLALLVLAGWSKLAIAEDETSCECGYADDGSCAPCCDCGSDENGNCLPCED